jgi:hypothetical protein
MSQPQDAGVTRPTQCGPSPQDPPRDRLNDDLAGKEYSWVGSYCGVAPDGHGNNKWNVTVFPLRSGAIQRRVLCGDKEEEWENLENWRPELIISPTWMSQDGRKSSDEPAATVSPLFGVQDYWRGVSDRIRDSAKWMAAVLGAALAALIGTSPLAEMRGSSLQDDAIRFGLVGFLLLSLTLFLVLQVLRPQSTSFEDVQTADRHNRWNPARWWNPLRKWKNIVETQQDLYLPSGVKCLTTLRQAMIVDEFTLMALSEALANEKAKQDVGKISEAQKARAARLNEWRMAASRVATIGEFYRLRRRSAWATYLGAFCGVMGTAAIVAAFVVQ